MARSALIKEVKDNVIFIEVAAADLDTVLNKLTKHQYELFVIEGLKIVSIDDNKTTTIFEF